MLAVLLGVHSLLLLPTTTAPEIFGQVGSPNSNISSLRDVIYDLETGYPFDGTITLEPQHFDHGEPPVLVIPVSDGMLSVKLIPTDSPSTPLAEYTATYSPVGRSNRWIETWRVPNSDRLSLKDVRTSGPPASITAKSHEANSNRDVTLPIPIIDVSGLSSTLNTINTSLTTLSNTVGSIIASIGAIQNAQVIRGELPKGVINGTNVIFTLANLPNVSTLSVSLNGTRLNGNGGFSVAGTTITLASNEIPQIGDILSADYGIANPNASSLSNPAFRAVTLPIPITGVSGLSGALNQISTNLTLLNQDFAGANAVLTAINCPKMTVGEAPGGAVNGANTVFSVSSTTAIPSTIAVYLNGLRQSAGVDYSLIQTSISFLQVAVPQSGDVLSVDYCWQ